jgi:4'-phosphopantetheinyl transferase
MPQSLENGQVDLWYVLLEKADQPELLERYRAVLPPEERQREQRFLAEKARLQHLVGRLLMRTALSHYRPGDPSGWVFSYNAHGKPSIRWANPPRLEFNLSHTQGLAVFAVTLDHEIGVDVEAIERRPDILGLARRFFAPPEAEVLEQLPSADQPSRFLEFWTLKEAFIKAHGSGLALPLDQFAFSLSVDQPPRIAFFGLDQERRDQWQFAQVRLHSQYQIALAVRQAESQPLKIRLVETVPLVWQSDAQLLPDSATRRWNIGE